MKQEIKQRIEQIENGDVPRGYRKTKIGIVPNEWEEKFIKDICDLSSGSTPSRSDKKNFKGDILWVTSGELKQRYIVDTIEKISIEALDRNNLKLYQEGTIVIAIYGLEADGVRGTASIVKNKCTISQACMAFTNFKETNNEWYYYWYIFNGEIIGRRYAQGTKQQNLSTDIVANFRIAIPSINEQQKIADILSIQDKVIELKERFLKEKQKQKKYLLQNLVTGKKRLKGFNGEWKKVKLSKILKSGNKVPVKDTAMYTKITVKLNFKGLDFANINRNMVDSRPFYIRNKDEIIIGKQNYFNGSVAIVDSRYDGCICSNAIMSFSVKDCDLYFVYSYITQIDFLKKYEHLANGTGQKELSEKEFLNFEIILPSLEEQKAIAEILTTADKELKLLQEELEEEKRKKKALMQLLLTGIVRVKN